MDRKELTKTFRIISKYKRLWFSMVYIKYFRAVGVNYACQTYIIHEYCCRLAGDYVLTCLPAVFVSIEIII